MFLEIKNLHAGYGEHEVLHGVDMEAKEGEIIALIGPNGAGKSTILKSMMSLTNVTSGKIMFKDRDITRMPTHGLLEEGIGLVPQGRLVFPSLTVKENLEMGGYLIDHKETLAKNMASVLDRFPRLKEKVKERAGVLSGGEQQMVAIGRALMMSPSLLMLDEPSLGLSPKATQELFEKLVEINAAGTALVIVEQNVRLILRYASRGYLLAGGRVKFHGTAAELSDPELMRDAYLI